MILFRLLIGFPFLCLLRGVIFTSSGVVRYYTLE
jgi:hypothetical protein